MTAILRHDNLEQSSCFPSTKMRWQYVLWNIDNLGKFRITLLSEIRMFHYLNLIDQGISRLLNSLTKIETQRQLHDKKGPQCIHVWLTIRIKLNYLEKMKDI